MAYDKGNRPEGGFKRRGGGRRRKNMTRLEKKGACHARTVYEESLKQAFVDALNQLTGGSETYLSILQENMTEVIEMEQSNLPEEIQRKSDVLQKKLIECAERHEDYEEINIDICRKTVILDPFIDIFKLSRSRSLIV